MVASVLCGLMYQQSPIRAARFTAMSALAPIQIGGVGCCSGLLDGGDGGDRKGEFCLQLIGKGIGTVRCAAPDGDGLERAHFRNGAGVGGGLLTGAEDGEMLRVRKCKGVGSNGAGCRGADGGDLAGVHGAHRRAGVGLEEDDEALVRLHALRGILREDADELCAEGCIGAERSGHDAEKVAIGERNDGAEKLPGFACGEDDHRITHERDADLVGEAPGYFFAVDKTHGRAAMCCDSGSLSRRGIGPSRFRCPS